MLTPIGGGESRLPFIKMNAEELAKWEDRKRAYDRELVRQRIEDHRLARLRQELGERWDERTFEKFREKAGNEACLAKAREVVGSGFTIGAGFYGEPGNGKTHLAAAIIHSAIRAGKSARMTTLKRLVDAVIAAERAGHKDDVLASYVSVDVFVIDELGKEDQVAWKSGTRYDIINGRYETGNPLIVTFNRTLDEITAFYDAERQGIDRSSGSSMMDRIGEMCGGVQGFRENTAPSERWASTTTSNLTSRGGE